MWPFKSKEIQRPSQAKSIYRGSIFDMFIGTPVTYKNIYTDTQNNQLLTQYFNTLAEVAAPVLKYADMAGQINVQTNIPEVDNLLKNPNYYQGWNEFISQMVMNKRLYGNSIVNLFTPVTVGKQRPTALFNLSPVFTSIKTTDSNDFRVNKIENYIFDTKEPKKTALQIDPKFILHVRESNPNFKQNQYLFGISRFAGCEKNIESIKNGYDAKTNLYKNGPRMIITGKAQGEFSAVNSDDDIKIVQDKMKKYGYAGNEYNTLITDMPLDVTMASLNVAQLRITENNASDFQRLCDAQNIDSKCFSDNQGATFSNKEAALRDFANGAFKSEIESTLNDFMNKLREWWPSLDYTIDYSNINEIVKAELEANDRLLNDCKLGLITRNQYLEWTGAETISRPDFNEFYFMTNTGWIPLTQNQNGQSAINQ